MANRERFERNAHRLREHDPHYGMTPWTYALIFGLLSGTSLPIGAWLGVKLSPVSAATCARMMAFGAGALLFAVTVELYGHALHELEKGRLGLIEMFTTILGALGGAAFYLSINQWLEHHFAGDEDKAPELEEGAASSHSASHATSETAPLLAALKSSQAATEKAEKEEHKEEVKAKAKGAWKKLRAHVKITRQISGWKQLTQKDEMVKIRPREKAIRAAVSKEEVQHAKSVAFALFLGLLVDGVPEGILMGFLSAEGHLTPVLIVSLFVANFPEAFSSASLLVTADMGTSVIVAMWTSLAILVGCLCGASCYTLLYFFPTYGGHHGGGELPAAVLIGIALVEGLTGGAMIACISAVMLPEAFESAGKTGPFYTQSGFMCAAGFLMSVAMKAVFG